MPKPFFEKPSLRLQFQPVGKWDEAIRTLQRLSPAIKAASLAAQIAVCKEIQKKVKGHLRNQDLPWRPLNVAYKARKRRMGLDSRMLLSTHAYYDAIEVITKGTQHLVYVGVKRGVYGRKPDGTRNHLEIAQIALIHEYSANNKRKRALWNPTMREMGSSKGIKELYTQNLVKQLRKRRIPISVMKGMGI